MAPLADAPKTPDMAFWEMEPEDIDGLMARYNIEVKIPGRHAGTTLFYVPARDRNGKTEASLYFFELQFVFDWITYSSNN